MVSKIANNMITENCVENIFHVPNYILRLIYTITSMNDRRRVVKAYVPPRFKICMGSFFEHKYVGHVYCHHNDFN